MWVRYIDTNGKKRLAYLSQVTWCGDGRYKPVKVLGANITTAKEFRQ